MNITSALDTFRDEPIKLIYCSHPRWPLSPNSVQGYDHDEEHIDISILDSSFNPPTLAHLALSRLSMPPSSTATGRIDFNAKLLLYSMKNADKVPKLGDTTSSERIEMMILLAKELESASGSSPNVAVAVCQEPIFVEKSKILRDYLMSRMTSSPMVRLTFLLGTDTLERLFMAKYYGTEEDMRMAMRTLFASDNGTRVLCARRAFGQSYSQSLNPELSEKAHDYIASGAVVFTDIDGEQSSVSSSEVRVNIQQGKTLLWKSQVLNTIAQYIEERGLYRER